MNDGMELAIAKDNERSSASAAAAAKMSREEKRKAAKKEKRKQKRKEVAEKEHQEEEARLNDPEEQRRIQFEEEQERERLERERREFEERERLFLEELARKKAQEEEEEERRRVQLEEEQKLKEQQLGHDMEPNDDEEWEYVEEGPPEIIWQGNEIIVKKNTVRVKKKSTDQQLLEIKDQNRPISNPFPPQSEAFADYRSASTVLSAQELLENIAQQTPNFGTEQDKAHCPFHLKTGACRFGMRCSRVHFYPEKTCTLLIKNMYNGPGLAWEQDEGLEYTEEEVERSFEEFYEDVHTEFLKFGEIVNFKVCRNGSPHLRGNVYVHYKSLESAVLAYHSINGRYFAGKQVSCEFVAVTRWRVAICGEYMKTNLKICSRGSACNFIHCFPNPGGDYEWANWDKPPPRFWVEKMAALFGYSDQSKHDRQIEKQETPGRYWDSSKRLTRDRGRYHRRRSRSKEIDSSNRSSSDPYEEDNVERTKTRLTNNDKRRLEVLDGREGQKDREETGSRHHRKPSKKRSFDRESDVDLLDRDRDADMYRNGARKNSRYHKKESYDYQEARSNGGRDDAGLRTNTSNRRKESYMHEEHRKKSSRQQEVSSGIMDDLEHKKRSDSSDSSKVQSYEDRDSVSCNSHRVRKSYDSDSTCELSDGITETSHGYGRTALRHSTEVSRFSDDYRVSHKSSNKKSKEKESEQEKSELRPVKKRRSSSRKYRSSRKNVEFESPDEAHVHTTSSQCDQRRSKSYDSDFSHGSSKIGSVEPRKGLPKKSKTKFGSHEKFGHDHSSKENERDDSRDSRDEDADRGGRWEPNQDESEKQHRHKRKSWDQTSDQYLKESRSGGSSKSKKMKHETCSMVMDSDANLEGLGEDGKTKRKYRNHGSKRRDKGIVS